MILTMMLSTSVHASEQSAGAAAASEDTTFTLEEMLQYALEDERLAQAEYEAILANFDVTRPFSNILKAEVQHEAEIIELYNSLGLNIPDFDPSTYVVIPDTLEEIYTIGVEAEIANIAMYDSFLEQTLDPEVEAVFIALRDGSVKHLAAFERGLSKPESAGQMSGQANSAGESNGSRQQQAAGAGKGASVARGNGGNNGNESTRNQGLIQNQMNNDGTCLVD